MTCHHLDRKSCGAIVDDYDFEQVTRQTLRVKATQASRKTVRLIEVRNNHRNHHVIFSSVHFFPHHLSAAMRPPRP